MSATKGILYLIPTPLAESDTLGWLAAEVKEVINTASLFVVEEERSARRFLKKAGINKPLQEVPLQVLNEHTPPEELSKLLQPLLDGKTIGLLSEAGCPAVADPGADLVRLAHRNNIKVVPFVGPSSLLLTLMASGLNGQSFAFNGYLPRERPQRIKKIKDLERLSAQFRQTQLFIETPYRNLNLLEDLLATCDGNTLLTIASDISSAQERIHTYSISEWKKRPKAEYLHKVPAVFAVLR